MLSRAFYYNPQGEVTEFEGTTWEHDEVQREGHWTGPFATAQDAERIAAERGVVWEPCCIAYVTSQHRDHTPDCEEA
jgi:hypothetical protein